MYTNQVYKSWDKQIVAQRKLLNVAEAVCVSSQDILLVGLYFKINCGFTESFCSPYTNIVFKFYIIMNIFVGLPIIRIFPILN